MLANQFPYSFQHGVIFQDLDAMQHVNNGTYITYLETARINYLHSLFEFPDFASFPVIQGDIYCRYLAPAVYGDVLTVGVGVNRFGRKSFTFIYQIDNQHNTPVAYAKTTMVTFDYKTQKTIEVPQNIRSGITKFQGDWHHDFVV